MKKTVLTVLASLLTPLAALAQFEGVIEMKITAQEGGGTGKVYVSKAGSRTEMEMKGTQAKEGGPASMKMTMLVKAADPEIIYNINDERKSYSVMDLKKMKEQAAKYKQEEDTYTVKKLGSGTVAGFACENALLTSKKGMVIEACFAKDIYGSSSWMSQMGKGRRGGDTGFLKAAKDAGIEGAPIKMINKDKDGKVISTSEVVKAEKKSLPASTFEIPAGYKETSMMGTMIPQEALDKMTPEQRKMMEDMMKKQGGGGAN